MGGYFCVLLLRPMTYPRLKQVIQRLITAMRPSNVNIVHRLLSFPNVTENNRRDAALRKGG